MLEEFYTVDSHSECANDNTPAFKNISNYVLVDVGKKDTVKLVTRKKNFATQRLPSMEHEFCPGVAECSQVTGTFHKLFHKSVPCLPVCKSAIYSV